MLQQHPLGVPFQGTDQLKRHSRPTEVRKGVNAVLSVGVHHRGGVRQNFPRPVMVGDHHIHPLGRCAGNFLYSGNTVVHCDNQLNSGLLHPMNHRLVEAVPLPFPLRDVVEDIRPGVFQVIVKEDCGGDAVAVVVPVNQDFLAAINGPADPLHRLIHIRQKHRIVQRACLLQKGPGGFRLLQPPRFQHRRKKTSSRHVRRPILSGYCNSPGHELHRHRLLSPLASINTRLILPLFHGIRKNVAPNFPAVSSGPPLSHPFLQKPPPGSSRYSKTVTSSKGSTLGCCGSTITGAIVPLSSVFPSPRRAVHSAKGNGGRAPLDDRIR